MFKYYYNFNNYLIVLFIVKDNIMKDIIIIIKKGEWKRKRLNKKKQEGMLDNIIFINFLNVKKLLILL